MDMKVKVDFGYEPQYIFDTLTSDISTADSIIDLIDNSVDAARRDMSQSKRGIIKELPESYLGYSIDVKISKHSIEIYDNCHGMEEAILAHKAFKLGARHEQNYSIGMYGVGLIRAFWKLSNTGLLRTDNSSRVYEMHFSKDNIKESADPIVFAESKESSKQKFNHLILSDLTDETVLDFSDKEWIKLFKEKVRRSFGLCIRKGLKIKIDDEELLPFGPGIRDISQLMTAGLVRTTDGVSVRIETGPHEDYLFSGENGHSPKGNERLTKQFGWYIVCNDRIVLAHDLSVKVGWTSVWHSEYNGFVGWAHFISADPRLLPWDSTKSDISLEKRSQREIAPELRKYADAYRRKNRNFRYSSTQQNSAKESEETDSPQSPSTRFPNQQGEGQTREENNAKSTRYGNKKSNDDGASKNSTKKLTRKHHNDTWNILFPGVEIGHNDAKLMALIFEAQNLSLSNSYSSAMIFRITLERVINLFLSSQGHLRRAKIEIINELESENPLSNEFKRKFRPQLTQTINWISKNEDIFSEEIRRDAMDGIKALKAYLPQINKIVHEGALTSSEKMKILRDDCWPAVKIMIENRKYI